MPFTDPWSVVRVRTGAIRSSFHTGVARILPWMMVILTGCTEGHADDLPGWAPAGPVTEPRLFAPGVVSTEGAEEYGVSFSPDGREVFFTRRESREPQRIWTARWETGSAGGEGSWSEPAVVPFGRLRSETPWMAPDGRTLYFSSRRPGAFDGPDESDNLWVVERDTAGAWGEPRPVAGEVNRPQREEGDWPESYELNPVLGPDGALYYWSELAGSDTDADILRAEPLADGGGFGPGEPLPWPLNSEGAETHFAFGPGGEIVFQSYGQPGSIGFSDLFVSFPDGAGGWSVPRALPEPVNTIADELFPSFSPDGRYLFFGSDRASPNGDPSIWFVEWAAVDLSAAPLRP